MLCDKHVVKMILEACQMLSTACHLRSQRAEGIYKPTHINHPTCIWVRGCVENFKWTARHAVAIGKEYTRRYGKRHACQDMAEWFLHHPIVSGEEETYKGETMTASVDIPVGCSPVPLAIKNKNLVVYKGGKASLVLSYRKYYLEEKRTFASWKMPSKPPRWWDRSQNEIE